MIKIDFCKPSQKFKIKINDKLLMEKFAVYQFYKL